MAKKAVISGSNGFIGRHLWDALVERDIEPIALTRDDLYSHVPQLIETLHYYKPNYIFHLAAYGNHGMQTDVTQTIMANYWTTYNLLKASEMLEYEAFINIATSSMYGKKETAMVETTGMQPDTFYAATKAGAAYLARAFAMQYNKPIASVVPFSVYGKGEADFRFIPTLCNHLVSGEEMSIVLQPTHDWIYIDDFISGMLSVVDNINTLQGETINIGNGVAITNKEVIDKLCAISKKKLFELPNYNEQPHHSPLWVSDNTKLKSLGWKQKTSLHDGLVNCWDYYSKLYDKEQSS